MRRRLFIAMVLSFLLPLFLTACQKNYNAYVGTWYQLSNYDTFSIAQNGDALLLTYKGEAFPVDTQHDVPTVILSILGAFSLVMNTDKSLLDFGKGVFTKDTGMASDSYTGAAQRYIQDLLGRSTSWKWPA